MTIEARRLRTIVAEWVQQIRDGSSVNDEDAISIIREIGSLGTEKIRLMFRMMDDGSDAEAIADAIEDRPAESTRDLSDHEMRGMAMREERDKRDKERAEQEERITKVLFKVPESNPRVRPR